MAETVYVKGKPTGTSMMGMVGYGVGWLGSWPRYLFVELPTKFVSQPAPLIVGAGFAAALGLGGALYMAQNAMLAPASVATISAVPAQLGIPASVMALPHTVGVPGFLSGLAASIAPTSATAAAVLTSLATPLGLAVVGSIAITALGVAAYQLSTGLHDFSRGERKGFAAGV